MIKTKYEVKMFKPPFYICDYALRPNYMNLAYYNVFSLMSMETFQNQFIFKFLVLNFIFW